MFKRILRIFPSETIEGYEHPELVELIFKKTVAFNPTSSWSEINDAKTVLDFGGGCGLHYKQAKSRTVRWAVVETPAMVARAIELQTERLHFFTEIQAAKNWLGYVDTMHSNGALHFATDPLATAKELCSVGAQKLLWYRCQFSSGGFTQREQVSRLADNGPGSDGPFRKNVRYRFTLFPESDFLAQHDAYNLRSRGTDWFHFDSKQCE